MVLRATTVGVLRGYRNSLQKSFQALNSSRNTVTTQRIFNSYAEDPAAASQAFQLRRARMRIEAQYTVLTSTQRKYDQAWSALDSVSELVATENGTGQINNLKGLSLRDLNDPEGGARSALNKALDQISQTIIQSMNAKYGDNFVFAGADGRNVPFEIRDDNKLYYRGVPVDAGVPELAGGENNPITVDTNGNYDANGTIYLSAKGTRVMSAADYQAAQPPALVQDNTATPPVPQRVDETGTPDPAGEYYLIDDGSGDTISIEEYNQKVANAPSALADAGGTLVGVNENGEIDPAGTYYLVVDEQNTISQKDYETNKENLAKLDYLVDEKYFVDIGLGFKENENGQLIESSGFNAALNGIKFIGYGLDEDGDPKNIYSITQKLVEVASRADENGRWTEPILDEFNRLVGKLEDATSEFSTQYVNMDAESQKLKNNAELLTDNHYTLQEQYSELEDVEPADAITAFIWAQYSYNAALKVGNSIFAQSLMDYMS